jgi:hypothetical protein
MALFLFACKQLSPEEKQIIACLNSSVNLSSIEYVYQGEKKILYSEFRQEHPNFSLVYLKAGCGSCYLSYAEWHIKMDSINIPDNYSVLFIISGEDCKTFIAKVEKDFTINDNYYHIEDFSNSFQRENKKIPFKILQKSILIDANNKIKMIGKPFINDDMKLLFMKKIDGV